MENKTTIYKKLLEIKKETPFLQKDSEGHHYKYASPEKVLGEINPKLNEKGLFLTTEIVNTGVYGVLDKDSEGQFVKSGNNLIRVKMRMTITDVETEEQISIDWAGYGHNNGEKGFGSALTYAERYFFLKLFNIPTGDDDPDSRQGGTTNSKQEGDLQNDINNGNIDF